MRTQHPIISLCETKFNHAGKAFGNLLVSDLGLLGTGFGLSLSSTVVVSPVGIAIANAFFSHTSAGQAVGYLGLTIYHMSKSRNKKKKPKKEKKLSDHYLKS